MNFIEAPVEQKAFGIVPLVESIVHVEVDVAEINVTIISDGSLNLYVFTKCLLVLRRCIRTLPVKRADRIFE